VSDRQNEFKEGTEESAKLADRLAEGIASGKVLPSCENPLLVSKAFVILAHAIRKLNLKT
jgi:hypothetical protein